MHTIHTQDATAPITAAAEERRRRYAAEMEPRRRASMRELEELFDRRNNGVAPMRRFREKLRFHVAIYGDGKAGTSEGQIFGELLQAERRLQRAQEGTR